MRTRFGRTDSVSRSFLTGVFAVQYFTATAPMQHGSRAQQIIVQLYGVVATWALAAIATFILLKIVDALVGLRVTPEEERAGLDLTQHGEEGYIF